MIYTHLSIISRAQVNMGDDIKIPHVIVMEMHMHMWMQSQTNEDINQATGRSL